MQTSTVKVGVVQQAISGNDKYLNWQQSADQIDLLAVQGCRCILLQELHSTLYFCQTEDTKVFDLAEPLEGEAH